MTWTAPARNGGSAITGYTVTASNGASPRPSTGAGHCTITGLTNGTAYTFTVTATNAVGTGASSLPTKAVVPGAAAAMVGAPS